ncbi:MAG: hypothetical protein RI925_2044 [Pseudomonadota bacterium]|jgi:hypothetical protein
MNRMQWDSRFFLTGAGVMAVLFLLDGDWLLLPVCLLALMWGARLADSERVARLVAGEGDEDALSMLFEPVRSHSLLPLDHFRCRELMFYRSGWPVYRFLRSSRCWFEFVGESEQVATLTEQHILVFPGVVYLRRDDLAQNELPSRR